MPKPKVSVLVAVYNAAEYLPGCLDSLLAQTLDDIQIICIDDCSADASPDILYSYSRRDDRVQVIRLTENHGQAYARNQGLAVADGEYVCMLDADDWYSPDALASAVAVFESTSDTDCVLFDVLMEYPDRSESYAMPCFGALTGSEAFELSLTWRIHGIYMVRTSIHRRWPYDDTCRLYSDDNTTRMHYLASRSVRRCQGCYHYRQHAASATHVVSVRRFDYLRANESMLRQMHDAGVSPVLMALYENHRWLNLIDVYMFYHCHGRRLTAEERRHGLGEILRVWQSIDRKVLDRSVVRKFGYRPMSSWRLFRIQEWLYFTLRGLLGKNK